MTCGGSASCSARSRSPDAIPKRSLARVPAGTLDLSPAQCLRWCHGRHPGTGRNVRVRPGIWPGARQDRPDRTGGPGGPRPDPGDHRLAARVTTPGEDGGGLADATVTADLDLGSLAVREGTGGAKPLTDRDRRDIQNQARKILGDAARAGFDSPRVIPSSTSSSGAPSARRDRGHPHPARRLAAASGSQVTSPAPGRYRGSATIRQTDFGITPYSGFFGALKLHDEVTVEFEVTIEGLQNGSA